LQPNPKRPKPQSCYWATDQVWGWDNRQDKFKATGERECGERVRRTKKVQTLFLGAGGPGVLWDVNATSQNKVSAVFCGRANRIGVAHRKRRAHPIPREKTFTRTEIKTKTSRKWNVSQKGERLPNQEGQRRHEFPIHHGKKEASTRGKKTYPDKF